MSAAREGGDKDVPSFNWEEIAGSSQGRTDWQFHPTGSQFRNGAVEVMVKKFKRTLKHKFSGRLMFLLELEAGFKIRQYTPDGAPEVVQTLTIFLPLPLTCASVVKQMWSFQSEDMIQVTSLCIGSSMWRK